MTEYNIVMEQPDSTVIAEYVAEWGDRPTAYQSEAELEKSFIAQLSEQGYEYLPIHSESDLLENLRAKLSELNNYAFTDAEWKRFFKDCIANENEGIAEKTRKIQEDSVQVLKRDGGTSRNIMLIDKKHIHNNKLQVINQYAVSQKDGAKHDNRYDVTILVNGFPLVHIELKRRTGKEPPVFHHRPDLRGTAAHLYHRGRHQRQKRAAFPGGLHQDDGQR